MKCLLDTNILLRLLNTADPQHGLVVEAMDVLIEQEYTLVVTPQVLIEFYVVATRPTSVNGFGWKPRDAARKIADVSLAFPMLPDTELVFTEWLGLVESQGVSGKRTHDARLVAVMAAHGVDTILTLNVRDFEKFPGIHVLHPADVDDVASSERF